MRTGRSARPRRSTGPPSKPPAPPTPDFRFSPAWSGTCRPAAGTSMPPFWFRRGRRAGRPSPSSSAGSTISTWRRGARSRTSARRWRGWRRRAATMPSSSTTTRAAGMAPAWTTCKTCSDGGRSTGWSSGSKGRRVIKGTSPSGRTIEWRRQLTAGIPPWLASGTRGTRCSSAASTCGAPWRGRIFTARPRTIRTIAGRASSPRRGCACRT